MEKIGVENFGNDRFTAQYMYYIFLRVLDDEKLMLCGLCYVGCLGFM